MVVGATWSDSGWGAAVARLLDLLRSWASAYKLGEALRYVKELDIPVVVRQDHMSWTVRA